MHSELIGRPCVVCLSCFRTAVLFQLLNFLLVVVAVAAMVMVCVCPLLLVNMMVLSVYQFLEVSLLLIHLWYAADRETITSFLSILPKYGQK